MQNCQFEAPYYCLYTLNGQINTNLSFDNKFLMKSTFAVGGKNEEERKECIRQLKLRNVFDENNSQWPWHLSANVNARAR